MNNNTPHIVPVILCGGSGTRLWPLSREIYPKPFVEIQNGRTLFLDTLERIAPFAGDHNLVIVCNEEHRFYVLKTLRHCKLEADIILEPKPRNTAPAIALAAFDLPEDAIMLVAPSDHFLGDPDSFRQIVIDAAPLAAKGYILTFAIQPLQPETGYGYIEKGADLGCKCFQVKRFVEKPSVEKASAMLEAGDYFWNSGIFLLKAGVYLDELRKFSPDIYENCLAAWQKRDKDANFIRPDTEAFLNSPEDSIDYAIMEHTNLAAMAPLNCAWSDLGSWEALYKAAGEDSSSNVCSGDIITDDVERCYLHAGSRLLAAIGLRDMVVVEGSDAVLVMPRDRAQDVKKIVKKLKEQDRQEFKLHPLVYRPWGSYETLVHGSRFQVKRIIVNPDCSLSLQMHHHRSEHWIIVRGTAEITLDDETKLYTENQSVYIPLGTRHKLRNPGIIPVEIIEVQSGSYLGEDDIVRIEDAYGRK